MSNSATDAESSPAAIENRTPVARAVALRWKHALTTFVVGTTTYALYSVGGWTIDAAVFGLATLAIVAYSVATYRGDAR